MFVLFFKGLGDAPARNYCEQPGSGKCTPGKLASIEHGMGTDRCVFANYGTWVRGRRTW